MKLWYMYIVECSDKSLYTGVTTDINRRVDEHNYSKKGAKYTRSRRPVRLVYFEEFKDKSSAFKAESKFKKLTRKNKLRHVKNKAKDSNN